jgi:hypothetical protein
MQIKDSYESLKEGLNDKSSGNNYDHYSDYSEEGSKRKESSFRYYQRQSSQFKNSRSSSSDWDFKTEEEYIFSLVFGYNWDEDVERFMLKENAQKRAIFIEKVIELRRTKFRQDTESTGEGEREEPEDKFGQNLDQRAFISEAFQTRFSGLGNTGSA